MTFATYPSPSLPQPRIGLGDSSAPGGGTALIPLLGAPILGGLIGGLAASEKHRLLGATIGAGLAFGVVIALAKITQAQDQAAIAGNLKDYRFSGPIPAGATTGPDIANWLNANTTWKNVAVMNFDATTYQAIGAWDDTSGSAPPASWNAVPA